MNRFGLVFRPLVRPLLDLLFRPDCALCDRPAVDGILCTDCQRRLRASALPPARQWQPGSPPLLAWGTYGGTLKRAIAAFKYDGRPQLARPLGEALADRWNACPDARAALGPGGVAVPVPIHPSKRQQRGFNQAELLANWFGDRAGIPVRDRALVRVRETQAQFGLSPAERQKNVRAAFALGPDFRRRRPPAVAIVDDIYTTGATVRAMTAVLARQGVRVAAVVVVARTVGDRPVPSKPTR